MKRSLFCLAALMTTGCGGVDTSTIVTDANVSQGAVSAVDLLAQGSASVCSHSDVRTTLLSMVKPKINPNSAVSGSDIENALGQFTYSLDLITLAGVDKEISSVNCDANLIIRQVGNDDSEYSIRYLIRPSVEDPSDFIMNANISAAKADVTRNAQLVAYQFASQREVARNEQLSASANSDELISDESLGVNQPRADPSEDEGSEPEVTTNAEEPSNGSADEF